MANHLYNTERKRKFPKTPSFKGAGQDMCKFCILMCSGGVAHYIHVFNACAGASKKDHTQKVS